MKICEFAFFSEVQSKIMDYIIPLLAENDEEIIIFDEILNTPNRQYHYLKKKDGVFRLDDLDDNYCHTHFRFYKRDIRRLIVLFEIPDRIILKNRVTVSGEEALCILLRRLAYPNRYKRSLSIRKVLIRSVSRYADLMQFFPRGRSALSGIFNALVKHILIAKGYVLEDLNRPWLSRNHVRRLCLGLYGKGSPYRRCFAFLDGTVKATCRPKYNQRQVNIMKAST